MSYILPKHLKLFLADVIDEDTKEQYFYYVVGRSEVSALNRFIKHANKRFYRYGYYLHEIEDEDTIRYFIKYYFKSNNDIKAGIFER